MSLLWVDFKVISMYGDGTVSIILVQFNPFHPYIMIQLVWNSPGCTLMGCRSNNL